MSDRPQPSSSTSQGSDRARLIHRELLQLLGLMAITVVAFFLTRAVASSNRQMHLSDAEAWYQRGESAVATGRIDLAVDSFRRAAVRNRHERRYVLALARALTLNREEDAARSTLLGLRDTAPEDPVVNLELARLAARRGDVPEALRFYHAALYAPWTSGSEASRRRTRLELVRFLLGRARIRQGLSELLTMSSDVPDDVASHVQLAQLFAEAGDHAHALDQFERALRLAPGDRSALTGAGTSAFALGDYLRARQYLRRVPTDVAQAGEVAHTLSIVEYVLSNDPLANHIGTSERRRRLLAALSYVQQRLAICLERQPAGRPDDAGILLQQELSAFRKALPSPGRLEQDTIEAGVDLIDRIARRVVGSCGPATAVDRALTIIGQRHHGEPS